MFGPSTCPSICSFVLAFLRSFVPTFISSFIYDILSPACLCVLSHLVVAHHLHPINFSDAYILISTSTSRSVRPSRQFVESSRKSISSLQKLCGSRRVTHQTRLTGWACLFTWEMREVRDKIASKS